MTRDTVRNTLRSSGWTLLAVLVLLTAVTTASAAGETTVRLAAEDRVTVSGTTTVDVVVDAADGGVGAYNVTLAVADPATAEITGIELHGDPAEETARTAVAADGSSATAVAALADTNDTGSVPIVTVTLRGVEAGATDLDLTVTALGDERGHSYTTDARGAELTVGAGSSGGGGGGGGGSSAGAGDAEPTERPTAGTTETGEQPTERPDGDASGEDDADGTATPDSPSTTPTERSTTASGTPERTETTSSAPGFGLTVALVALLTAALLLRRDR